ncbi:uncharacterized protein LOC123710952 isoform X2 [Pieris brassicae]|uniref:uncharacterized protein LOC123710952 isoform X2 n=1 Tax=Pieris brassicae TaxID=7116 RepID=UPI001E660C53|nr:uncharacterized protein LOC123710952 isoform X2 [Pieris brassicae]
MEFGMTQEESYTDRRKLFKNIWDTAMTLEDKDANEVVSKPKVIKTLRLDEVDRCLVGKKKKQRLKNLRAVCNKLLDFCDRQDADDLFYEQMVAEGKKDPSQQPDPNTVVKKPKAKPKRKVIKAKSVFYRVTHPPAPKATTSERQDFSGNKNILSYNNFENNDVQRCKDIRGNKQGTFPTYILPARYKYVTINRPIPKPKPSKKLLPMHTINIR